MMGYDVQVFTKNILTTPFFVLVAAICSNYDVFLTRDCLGLLENKACSESDRDTSLLPM